MVKVIIVSQILFGPANAVIQDRIIGLLVMLSTSMEPRLKAKSGAILRIMTPVCGCVGEASYVVAEALFLKGEGFLLGNDRGSFARCKSNVNRALEFNPSCRELFA